MKIMLIRLCYVGIVILTDFIFFEPVMRRAIFKPQSCKYIEEPESRIALSSLSKNLKYSVF